MRPESLVPQEFRGISEVEEAGRASLSGFAGGESLQTDSVPIEIFVQTTILQPEIAELMTGWRFEQKVLEDVLIRALKEMGIYMVPPRNIAITTKAIVAQLQYSQEIMRMLKLAQKEAQMKQRSRHSE